MKLSVEIQKESGIPIYIQLEEQIRLLIRGGHLEPGTPMPTVREMAVELGINYNTVTRIYRDLQNEGFLKLRRGIGTFVAERVPGQPFQKKDLSRLKQKAGELIELGKEMELKPAELLRLIEITWKEYEHE